MDAWELASWDAVETAERIARRDVSSLEVIEAALARARDAAPLNALVTECADRARVTAATAPLDGPLFGVPTAIKDLSQLAGVRTAWGSAAAGEFVSTRSDRTVEAIERTGVIPIGKSATPELGLTGTTEPLAFGPTTNPWGRGRSPGGSSGGAAALVASGVVPIAHGSDGGGSIRIPASCCGLVGLKPSRFRLDLEGSNLLPVNLAVHGVLTRSVRDTVAFWNAVERELPPKRIAPIGDVAPVPERRLKLGFFSDSPKGTPVHPDVRAAAEKTATLCARLGHSVEAIACPFEAQVIDDFIHLWGFIAFTQMKGGRAFMHLDFDASKVEPFTAAFARQFSQHVVGSLAAFRRLRRFPEAWAKVLEQFDVLMTPTVAQVPPLHGYLSTDVAFEAALSRLLSFTPFTAVVNIAGAPAITLPLGQSIDGLPIGVQFAGAHGDERLLLELARELEAAQPWPHTAPRRNWR